MNERETAGMKEFGAVPAEAEGGCATLRHAVPTNDSDNKNNRDDS